MESLPWPLYALAWIMETPVKAIIAGWIMGVITGILLYKIRISSMATTGLQHEDAVCKDSTNTYTLYWRTGDRQLVYGNDVAQAMTLAGYGGGAIGALDFYANGDDTDYEWDSEKRVWVNKGI